MSLPFGDGPQAGWTVLSLQQEGGAPRYQAEKGDQQGVLTWYPFSGPYAALHQQLAERLKRNDKIKHDNLLPTDVDFKGGDGVVVVQPTTSRVGEEPLGGADACRALRRVAQALIPFHEQNMAHGELDPLCLVKSDGEVMLQPPGLRMAPPGVKKLGLDVDPRYAAPEVLDGIPPTPASDMFSLGLILFRLLSGKPPVPGADPSEAFAARGKTQAPDLTAATTSLKAPVLALYKKLTAIRPAQRPKSARDLVDDLNAMIDKAEPPKPIPLPSVEGIESVGIGTPLVLCLLFAGALGFFYLQATSVYTTESPAARYEFPRPGAPAKTGEAKTPSKTDDAKTAVKTDNAKTAAKTDDAKTAAKTDDAKTAAKTDGAKTAKTD